MIFVACGLLCLGVVTYSVALPFVLGAATWVLLRPDRWRRVWVFLLPGLLYFAWWLATRGSASTGGIVLGNVFLIPTWIFDALSSALGALTGLNHSF